jgi:lipid A 3-O-deacylase
MSCKHAAWGLAALAALPGAALAKGRPADQKGTLSFVGENDSLSTGADRNYTSGVKIAYVSPSSGAPHWLQGAGRFTRAFSGNDPAYWGIALGQSIFTPEDIEANPAPPDQHPYAGWLYMQIMVAAEENRPDNLRPRYLDTYELEFGVVGPSALGRQAQRGIHQILNAPAPQGWDSQLHDEFAFASSFDRHWRTLRLFTDYVPGGFEGVVTTSAGATLGTLRDEARGGVTLTLGQYLPDGYFGPPRVRPSLGGVEHIAGGGTPSWSIFAGLQARAVARDLFLDGNTFRDSAHVDKNNLVGDVQAGFTLSAGDWRMAYTFVIRTKEFKTQPTQQDFGAVALSWRF